MRNYRFAVLKNVRIYVFEDIWKNGWIVLIIDPLKYPTIESVTHCDYNYGALDITVEHKHQQNLKLSFYGGGFQVLNSVTVVCWYIKARHSFFEKLLADIPAHALCKVPASLPLHRNIVPLPVHLFLGIYSGQSIYRFHCFSSIFTTIIILNTKLQFCNPD